jgi:hypothetical protein
MERRYALIQNEIISEDKPHKFNLFCVKTTMVSRVVFWVILIPDDRGSMRL